MQYNFPSNITVVEELGTKISNAEDLKVYLEHPVTADPITVMLDACHMLKLVRNILHCIGCFIDINNNEIHWKYLSLLVERQKEEELHLATKIRHFSSQIKK